jgi:hypothetical protein
VSALRGDLLAKAAEGQLALLDALIDVYGPEQVMRRCVDRKRGLPPLPKRKFDWIKVAVDIELLRRGERLENPSPHGLREAIRKVYPYGISADQVNKLARKYRRYTGQVKGVLASCTISLG